MSDEKILENCKKYFMRVQELESRLKVASQLLYDIINFGPRESLGPLMNRLGELEDILTEGEE